MSIKPLTSDFLLEVFSSNRNLLWIQDISRTSAVDLIKETCKKGEYGYVELNLSEQYPLDLEDTMSKLGSRTQGLI